MKIRTGIAVALSVVTLGGFTATASAHTATYGTGDAQVALSYSTGSAPESYGTGSYGTGSYGTGKARKARAHRRHVAARVRHFLTYGTG